MNKPDTITRALFWCLYITLMLLILSIAGYWVTPYIMTH